MVGSVDIECCKRVAKERGGQCLSTTYIGSRIKMHWQCAKGHEFRASYNTVQQGHWCSRCRYDSMRGKPSPYRIGIERCREKAIERGGECLSMEYINCGTKLHWRCAKGHKWDANWDNIKHGSWCPICARPNTYSGQRIGIEYCKQYAIEHNGLCLSEKYINAQIPLRWYCNKHGVEWRATAGSVISAEHWCRKCGCERGGRKHRVGLERCQQTAKGRNGLCLSNEYVNCHEPMRWYCNKHGFEWKACAGSVVLSGTWCPECKRDAIRKRQTLKDGIERCRQIAVEHDGVCLSEVYVNNSTPMKWKCNKDGYEWTAKAANIFHGTWCPKCGGHLRNNFEDCKRIAAEREGVCLSTEFINSHVPMEWKCRTGHEWLAPFKRIRRGDWCPYCRPYGEMEARCRAILETIFGKPFKKSKPFKSLGSLLEIDCYNKELRVGLEYDGIQHREFTPHFNNKKGRPVSERDQEKNRLCERYNIALIRISDREASKLSGKEKLVDTVIMKLQSKKIPFTMLSEDVLKRLRNPIDPVYKDVWGAEYLKIFQEECKKRGGRLVSTEVWAGNNQRYEIECSRGHRFKLDYGHVVTGDRWCPACRREDRKRLNHIRGIERCKRVAIERDGLCLSDEYVNSQISLRWKCNKHNYEWMACAASVITAGSWCPLCGGSAPIGIERCKETALSRDGVCLSIEYVDSKIPMRWRCNKHDFEWSNSAGKVVTSGQWCPRCAEEVRRVKLEPYKHGIEKCKKIAIERNGLCLSEIYTDCYAPMKWYCNKHKVEWVAPATTIINQGSWCPVCGKEKRREKSASRKVGIERCKQWALSKGGECLSTEYVNSDTKLHWECAKGHEWWAKWGNISQGKWCPTCAGRPQRNL